MCIVLKFKIETREEKTRVPPRNLKQMSVNGEEEEGVKNRDPFDPLAGYSPFSLKLSSSSSSFPLSNPTDSSLLSNLKLQVLKNPDSLLKQANAILDSSKDLLQGDHKSMDIPVQHQNENENEEAPVPVTRYDKPLRERRPGLGLRRAKFSLKPMPSQPHTILEPTVDIANLSDPVEYFAACERAENAKKELQRLTGQPLVETDLNRPRRPRPRLFEKKAIYKPRSYPPIVLPGNDKAILSSQESHDNIITSPTHKDAMPEADAVNLSPGTRISEVKSGMSSKVTELDELLSYDYEGLDEEGVQNFLLDKLNIKPVEIEKFSLPDWPDHRQCEYASSPDALPITKHTTFASSSNKSLNITYQFRKSSSSEVSPIRHKNHLSSISILNEYISRLTPSKDTIAPSDIDSPSEVLSHPEAQKIDQVDEIAKRTDSHDIFRFSVDREEATRAVISPSGLSGNIRIANVESKELLDGISHSDQMVTSKDSHDIGKSQACGKENFTATEKLPSLNAPEITPAPDCEECMDEIRQTAQVDERENLFEIRSPTDGEENLAASGDVSSVPSEQDDQIAAGSGSVGEEAFKKSFAVEKSSTNGGDGETGEPPNAEGILIEKPNKKISGASKRGKRKQTEESTKLSQGNINEKTMNKERGAKAKPDATGLKKPTNKKMRVEAASSPPSKVKEKLRRHSLYEAGTKWEAGLRRSNRIRMRPLEFWRGERFLYGRVHNSVVSVIGVKYTSPTKNAGELAVKVKSFVSDEYKNMVEQASLY